MADLEKIVKIIFAGDDSGLGQTISSVGGAMDKLAGQVGSATKPLADLTDSVIKVDAVLAGLAAGALYVATTQAGKFGDSFSEISTLIDAPADKIAQFKDDVLAYGRDSTASLEEITGATYQIISATGDWENSLVLLSAAERLNVAGKGELEATTKLLATSLNAYGGTAADAADYSDILFKTVKVGVTNLTELSGSLGNVTGLASSAGVPFADLSAAVGALTGTVGDTSLAVTQIKSVLTAVVKPSEQAKQAAEELGIAFDTQSLAALGLDGFLRMVYQATDGNTEVMARLFGRVEGLNGALVLGADTSGKYAEALTSMGDRAGATAEAYEKMADNFALTNQKIINNLRITLVEVGTPLLDEWGAIADGIVDIFKGVSVGFDAGAFDPLIEFVEKLGKDLAAELSGIGEALPEALAGLDWSEFTRSLEELVEAGKNLFGDLFGNLDLTKPDDLEKAIQKIIDTFEKWVDLSKGIVQGLAPFLEKITELAGEFSRLDGDTATSAGSIAGWGKAINVVADFLPNVTAPLNLLSGAIGLLAVTHIPAFIAGTASLTPILAGLAPVIGTVAAAAGALASGWMLGEQLYNIPIVKAFGDGLGEATYNLLHMGESAAVAMEKQAAHTQELAKAAIEIVRVKEAAGELAEQKMPVITIDTELTGFFADVDLEEWKLKNLEGYEITVTADSSQAEEELKKVPDLWNKIILEDGTIIEIPVKVDSAGAAASAQDAKDKIDEKLPAEKLMEIKLQGDIDVELATIAAQAETLQTMFEWDAKVEIAGIEAAAAELVAVADLVGIAWQSTGDVISSALGVLGNFTAYTAEWNDIMDIIEREQNIREELSKATIDLTVAQTELIKAREKAIANGEGVITITTEGLEPALEQVLYSIVQKAQIKANEEGFNALLGI